jgi:hypothetical protein
MQDRRKSGNIVMTYGQLQVRTHIVSTVGDLQVKTPNISTAGQAILMQLLDSYRSGWNHSLQLQVR